MSTSKAIGAFQVNAGPRTIWVPPPFLADPYGVDIGYSSFAIRLPYWTDGATSGPQLTQSEIEEHVFPHLPRPYAGSPKVSEGAN